MENLRLVGDLSLAHIHDELGMNDNDNDNCKEEVEEEKREGHLEQACTARSAE